MRYALPIGKVDIPLILRTDIRSDYRVETSFDDHTYETIHSSGKIAGKQTLEWCLPVHPSGSTLFVRITDRTPGDGSGACLYRLELVSGAAQGR